VNHSLHILAKTVGFACLRWLAGWACILAAGGARAEFDAGGGRAISGNITLDASVGSIAGTSQTVSSDAIAHAGFIGQIYNVSGLLVTATPLVVPSGGSSQLTPTALLDDATRVPLSPLEVVWEAAIFPIASITPAGVATASTVTAPTHASVGARYLGFTGSAGLTVSPNLQPPVVSNLVVEVAVNTPKLITLPGHDPQGLPIAFAIVAQPGHGTLGPVLENQVSYAPATNFTGADAFSFVALNSAATSSVATVSITVAKLAQNITFDPLPDRWLGDPSFTLTATASSGLPVAFSVLSGPARLAGNLATLTGPGSVTIRASQPGNANYFAAPVCDRTFQVLAPSGNLVEIRRFPGTNIVKIGLAKFSGQGKLPAAFVSFDPAGRNGGAIARVGADLVFQPASFYAPDSFTCVVRYPSGDWVTNTVSITVMDNLAARRLWLLVEGADCVLGFAADPGLLWAIEYTTNPTSGWQVLGAATESAPGVYQFRDEALGGGRRFYRAVQSARLTQTITWDALPDKLLGDLPFPLLATASSGLEVSYSIISGPAVLAGHTITLSGEGVVKVRASQPGNSLYYAAPDREQSFNVRAPVGRLITVRRFPGTNLVKLDAIRLGGLGYSLVSADLQARNGGSISIEGSHLVYHPVSTHGADNFACVLRNSAGSNVTHTVSLSVIEEMPGRTLFVLIEAGDYVLGFSGQAGQTYIVQHSANPVSGWTSLGNAVETAPGIFQMRDIAPAESRRFYRVFAP
jgi:hypothetical protein